MNLSDIEIARRALAKDLEVLKRAEAIVKRAQLGHSSSSAVANENGGQKARNPGANTGLKNIILKAVAESDGIGATEARDLAIERGYQFSNSKNAASAVFSALKRLVNAGAIAKTGLKYHLKR